MIEILIETLISFYMFDINVFTNKWLYIPLLIPFIFYLSFFYIKWAILTTPIWMPFLIILKSFKRDDKK